jgi:glutamine synthetase
MPLTLISIAEVAAVSDAGNLTPGPSPEEIRAQAAELSKDGVVGVTIVWADNNGIPRSRTVPIDQLDVVAERGVGITTIFAVFDSHDGITFDHSGLSTPSGDIRLIPVMDRLVRLNGQPDFAWAPGRQVAADGTPWPYDQRGVLERQVSRAAERGLTIRAGYELEFFIGYEPDPDRPDQNAGDGAGDDLRPAHSGPAYTPRALLEVDEFAAQLLRDLEANGLRIGQLHAEYGPAQLEFNLAPADPVTAADNQLLARQTIHAAARAHGLRASFAPLVNAAGVGNGWHLHTSVQRDGVNLMSGDGPYSMSADGAAYLAGLLRDLPAITAVTAPSVPSLSRLRPGYWSSAYTFWGIENREAALRYVQGTPLLGTGHANVELKPSDASANPYLSLAVVIAAGLAGIEEGLTPPDPIQENPGLWTDERRAELGVARLPTTTDEQLAALLGNDRVRAALGEELADAFRAVRQSDGAWAADRPLDEIVQAHLWRY